MKKEQFEVHHGGMFTVHDTQEEAKSVRKEMQKDGYVGGMVRKKHRKSCISDYYKGGY